jgi:hypothetical protein
MIKILTPSFKNVSNCSEHVPCVKGKNSKIYMFLFVPAHMTGKLVSKVGYDITTTNKLLMKPIFGGWFETKSIHCIHGIRYMM